MSENIELEISSILANIEPYDSREDTRKHIRQVHTFIIEFSTVLNYRGTVHDDSKLKPPEKEAFDIATPKLKYLEFGSEAYKQSLKELGPALEHHYKNNSHHPEYYEDGIAGMDLFDLVEMICDWKASALRQKGNGQPNLPACIERFKIEPQLAKILANTLARWNDTIKECGLYKNPKTPVQK